MPARKHKGSQHVVDGYLELMPLMNVLVALLPMLLLSAVFVKVTTIDLDAPPTAEVSAPSDDQSSIALAITIRDDSYIVDGRRGVPKHVIDRKDDDARVQLAGALAGVVAQFPNNEEITIISQAHTRYEDIVDVMDISREAGLPSVSLLGQE